MNGIMLKTREKGVALICGHLRAQSPRVGDLDILEMRENSYNRIIRLARMTETFRSKHELFEVHIL